MAAADDQLAEELGVHPGLVASVRRDSLTEAVDWIRDPVTGRIDYTDSGRDRILSILDLKKNEGAAPVASPDPAPASDPAPAEPVAALPAPVRLKIARLLPNPLWVGVALPGGQLGEVAVRRRTGLRVGVLLVCQLRPCGRWECVHPGHAMPLPKNERGAVP